MPLTIEMIEIESIALAPLSLLVAVALLHSSIINNKNDSILPTAKQLWWWWQFDM